MSSSKSANESVDRLKSMYQEVDAQANALVQVHGDRIVCRRGCCQCCVDELTIFEVEAENIRRANAALLQTAIPHPPGACAFLDSDGACRIYEDRPYVCRTQGLPLRWLDEDAAGDFVEYRDICPLNDEEADEAIEDLPPDECWSIGPFEERLARMQLQFGNNSLTRVPLRSLFERSQMSND